MVCHALHPKGWPDLGRIPPGQWLVAATRRERLGACDDDDFDDDWDGIDGDPVTGPIWDPLEWDDEEEPQPEYGDFWEDPDEFED
ncbi:MAG: hypothetical protein HY288_10835 [Planctomycetia bacterium]|nr:hypothetical protein [Planctomycetia bacterium]